MKRVSNPLLRSCARGSQKGVVAVELAIVAPLFAILLIGILDVGGMARDHQVLQNAAREGARFSALPTFQLDKATDRGATEAMIKSRVIAYLANENITVTDADIALDQAYPLSVGGLTIYGSQITITYTRPLLTPGATGLIPIKSRQLRGSAVFRNFYD
mgnify:CR=1 FL=1